MGDAQGRVYSFEPVYAPDARLLILGTAPSAASLAAGYPYAHPRNCFWPLLFDVLGEPAADLPAEKRALLLRHQIALWDVMRSCVRPGSLDSAIRDPEPNDVGALLDACPQIERVLLNGGAAYRLYHRLLPGLCGRVEDVQMPSTSPAYTLPYAKKRAAWAPYLMPLAEGRSQ